MSELDELDNALARFKALHCFTVVINGVKRIRKLGLLFLRVEDT